MGILQEKLIDVVASCIRWGCLGMTLRAELLRIYIGWTSGQQDAFTLCDQLRDLVRTGACRHPDWLPALALNRVLVLPERALVVFGVGRGGFRDSNTRLHYISLPKKLRSLEAARLLS